MTTLAIFASDVERDTAGAAIASRHATVRDVDADLGLLAALFVGDDGVVLLDASPETPGSTIPRDDGRLDLQRRHLDRLGAIGLPTPHLVAVEREHSRGGVGLVDLIAAFAVDTLRPWGWSPRLAQLLTPLAERLGVDVQARVDACRRLGDKRATVALRRRLYGRDEAGSLDEFDQLGAVVVTLDALLVRWAVAEAAGDGLFVKAPFGGAGRDAVRLLPGLGEPTPSQLGWLRKTLREQGAVVVERAMARTGDLGLLRDDDGVMLPPHRAFCDSRGGFRGVAVGGDDITLPQRAALAAALTDAAAGAGYVGPCGLDLVERGDDAPWPVEINARTTIGHVGHRLARHQRVGSIGRLLLLSATDLRSSGAPTFAALADRLAQALPLDFDAGGGVGVGAVALAPPALARRTLPVWCVAKSSATLKQVLAFADENGRIAGGKPVGSVNSNGGTDDASMD